MPSAQAGRASRIAPESVVRLLCAVFCEEYARQMNRPHGENNARRNDHRRALSNIEREFDGLVQALMERRRTRGVRNRPIKVVAGVGFEPTTFGL